jgi:hypothetical protein
MVAKKAVLEDVSVVSEEVAGTACAAALRQVRRLVEAAPVGRAFAAIATLTDASSRAGAALEASSKALDAEDEDTAALHLARGVVLMGRMMADAKSAPSETQANPSYLKRRRVHFDL